MLTLFSKLSVRSLNGINGVFGGFHRMMRSGTSFVQLGQVSNDPDATVGLPNRYEWVTPLVSFIANSFDDPSGQHNQDFFADLVS